MVGGMSRRARRARKKSYGLFALLLIAGVSLGVWALVARAPDKSHRQLARTWAGKHELPVWLVERVITAESNWDPDARSHADARGLMQVTPITEREVARHVDLPGGKDLYDPAYNIRVGTTYLRILVNRFEGDAWMALAAYNWGPTRVGRLHSQHPQLSGRQLVDRFAPRETKGYVRQILGDQEPKLKVTDGPRPGR